MFRTVAGIGVTGVMYLGGRWVGSGVGAIGFGRRAIDDRLQEAVEDVGNPAGIFSQPLRQAPWRIRPLVELPAKGHVAPLGPLTILVRPSSLNRVCMTRGEAVAAIPVQPSEPFQRGRLFAGMGLELLGEALL